MTRTQRLNLAALLFATALFGTLAVRPTTRDVVRYDLSRGTPYAPSGDDDEGSRLEWSAWTWSAFRRAADAQPNDFPVQLALILQQEGRTNVERKASRAIVARLWALQPRFPNAPGLYAAILRYASNDLTPEGKPDPALLRRVWPAFDRAARLGKLSDPRNAFFPAMRAAGLFRTGRTAEAAGELETAARCPNWDDDRHDEWQGATVLANAAFQPGDPLAVTTLTLPLISREYETLREMAKDAVAVAGSKEKAGHPEAALPIRHATMDVGLRMTLQSRDAIEELTGGALVSIAASRLNGVPDPPYSPKTGNVTRDARRQRYVDHLTRLGRADEAAWARRVWADADEALSITRAALSETDTIALLLPLTLYQLAGGALLNAVVALAILGAVSWALGGEPAVERLEPVGRGVRWALWMAVVWVPGTRLEFWLLVAAAFGVGAYLAWPPRGRWQGAAAFAVAMASLALIPYWARVVVLMWWAAVSLWRRKRWAGDNGFARVCRASAIPTAAFLLLAAVPVTLQTAHYTTKMRDTQSGLAEHAGRYSAKRLGRVWPGG